MANRESLALANLAVVIVNEGSAALKDGKLDLFDAARLIKIILAAGPAVQDVGQVLSEVPSWTSQEREQVLAKLREIDLPDDKKEKLIEQALSSAVLLAAFILPLVKLNA